MILFLFSVALQLTIADAFLENCPFDRGLSVENKFIVDVLEAFDKDLSFVRASTGSRQGLNYNSIANEMRNFVMSDDERREIGQMVEMLQNEDALDEQLIPSYPPTSLTEGKEDRIYISYYHYLKAELFRLLGNDIAAMSNISDAEIDRQYYEGISVNELMKFLGLMTIQRVSKFNQDVDKLHGLSRSPDYEALRRVHSSLREEFEPLESSRLLELHSVLGLQRPIINSLKRREIGSLRVSEARASQRACERINPEHDDFKVHSIAKTSVEAILCEFAQKFAILEAKSDRTSWFGVSLLTHYDSVVYEISRIDAKAAEMFSKRVVPETEDAALYSVIEFGALLSSDVDPYARNEHAQILKTYAKYFGAEMWLRSSNRCICLRLAEVLLKDVKRMRELCKGVSIGKILELEIKIVLVSIECFHHRLAFIYGLNGSESEQEQDFKRRKLGNCDRLLPG